MSKFSFDTNKMLTFFRSHGCLFYEYTIGIVVQQISGTEAETATV